MELSELPKARNHLLKLIAILLCLVIISCLTGNSQVYTYTRYNGVPSEETVESVEIGELIMHPNGRVLNLQLSAEDYTRASNHWIQDIRKFTQTIYEYFEDDFDFIFLLFNEANFDSAAERFSGLDYVGQYIAVQNNIFGIGEHLYNNTTDYGSKGTLQGITAFYALNSLTQGPALHETLHRWANSALLTSEASHWGFSSVGGQLGGFNLDTLTDLGDGTYCAGVTRQTGFGTFANSGNEVPYSPFELYLMGLIPPEEVPDIHVAPIAKWETDRDFSTTGFDVYSIEDIIDVHGERLPSVEDSQKKFRSAVLVLSEGPMSIDEWNEVDEDVFEFGSKLAYKHGRYNFWQATGERAEMYFDNLQASIKPGASILIPNIPSLSDEELLSNITQKSFLDQTFVTEDDIKITSHEITYCTPTLQVEDSLEITLEIPENVALWGHSGKLDGGLAYLSPDQVHISYEGNMARFKLRFPEPGLYNFQLAAKYRGQEGEFRHIFSQYAEVSRGNPNRLFPYTLQDYYENYAELIEPVDGRLKAGQTYTLKMKVPGARSLEVRAILNNGEESTIIRGENGLFEGEFRARGSEIFVYANFETGQKTMLGYLVE